MTKCFLATVPRAVAGIFPFYFRRGAVRRGSNIKISEFFVKKRTIINDIRIKDYSVNNLLENRELPIYASKKLELVSHNKKLLMTFYGII